MSELSSKKFQFMVTLSDHAPVQRVATAMYCQASPDCPNITSQAKFMMDNRVWRLLPICDACLFAEDQARKTGEQ